MSTLHDARRALQAGLGLALVTTFALASGCMSGDLADEPGQSVEESTTETAEAAGPGIYRCTLAGGTIMGSLLVRPDGTCSRYSVPLAGASNMYCPMGACVSCYALHRDLGCILT